MSDEEYWTRRLRLSRRGLLRSSALAAAGLAGAALLGCGEDEAPPARTPTPRPDGTPAPGATPSPDGPRSGGRFGRLVGVPDANFNPITNALEGHYNSGVDVYDRLISPRLDERIYMLEAAESIELPDDISIVARLQEGLVFQDRPPVNGRPLLADDVVASQEYVRDEEAAVFGPFQKDSLERIEATDDRTVVVHLRRPNAYLFSATQLGHPSDQVIMPRELIEGDLNQTEPVGSGPYQMKEHQLQVRYLYERNPTFRRANEGLPYIDEREVIALADATAQEAAFRAEQVHFWGTPYGSPTAETADRVERDLGDRLEIVEALGLNIFGWNCSSRQDWSHDIRTREAIYRMFEPQEYIDLVANGWAVPVPGQLAAGLERWQLDPSETEQYKRHDPDEARRLLDASGFDLNHTYDLTTIQGGTNESALQVFAEQLRRVGVQTRMDVRPAGDWIANVTATGNYDFAVVGHPAYDTPQTPLRLNHTESRNLNAWMNIRDPEIDAMIEESETLIEPDANVALVKEIQLELLRRYAHLSYVYTAVLRQLRWNYLKDWETSITNGPMQRVEAWMDR